MGARDEEYGYGIYFIAFNNGGVVILILKGMTGALAPFSYLVYINCSPSRYIMRYLWDEHSSLFFRSVSGEE